MGFEMPVASKKEGKKTIEELSFEAHRIAREYKRAAEERGDFGSKNYSEFLSIRSKLQAAIKSLEKQGVAEENLRSLREELNYPEEMKR